MSSWAIPAPASTIANAGSGKTVTLEGTSLVGPDAGNYNLIGLPITTMADIDQATLWVNAVPASKVAGESDPAFSWTLSGFVLAETASSVGISGSASCNRDGVDTPGTCTITCTPGGLGTVISQDDAGSGVTTPVPTGSFYLEISAEGPGR